MCRSFEFKLFLIVGIFDVNLSCVMLHALR